jgi:DNA polymerase-3 subunit gamma/tau
LLKVAERWSLDTIIAALQILAEGKARLRGGAHARLLVELALVRVARLENFSELSTLIARLGTAGVAAAPTPTAVKKKTVAPEPIPAPPPKPVEAKPEPVVAALEPLSIVDVNNVWPAVLKSVGARLAFSLTRAEEFLTVAGPEILAVRLPAGYTGIALEADTPEGRGKVEQALRRLLKRPVTFQFERTNEAAEAAVASTLTIPQRRENLDNDPLVQKVVELFEARPQHVEYDEDLASS